MMAVFSLGEPGQGFGIVHVGSLERLPGTLVNAFPAIIQNICCEKGPLTCYISYV